jgi:plastocyanin
MKPKMNIYFNIFLFMAVIIAAGTIGCNKNSSTSPYNYGGNSPNGSPGTNEVWMQNMAYVPSTKTITAGTTITWTNKDNVTHTVTSGTPGNPDGIFDSGNLNPGQTFSFTFNTKGTFNYYCRIHLSRMTGIINVQ